jgi:cytochrome c biogenesis protein CcmG/thiol:disulfide interchange protein DsbE
MADDANPSRRLWLALLPALAFAGLAVLFWRGLSGNPSEVPSALIGRPVPAFDLPPVEGLGIPGLATADLQKGGVSVVNVWASWCVPCRSEHPLLMELARREDMKLYGINYKDKPENARRFLGSLGQPFAAVGADEAGRSAVDWGVYGVPETFVVDGKGIIRYKWIGPLNAEALENTVLKEIEKAQSD